MLGPQLAPALPRGMQDLILCVPSHEVWEASRHPGLFVVSLSAPAQLHALLTPLEAGLRAQLPPLEKGYCPSRAIIPNASRNNRISGPQPVHFVLFAFLPRHTVRNCSAHQWVPAALSGLQQLQHPASCQPMHTAPAVLPLPVQIPGRGTEDVMAWRSPWVLGLVLTGTGSQAVQGCPG